MIATAYPLDERLPIPRKRSRSLPTLLLAGPAFMNIHLAWCLTHYAEWFSAASALPATATVTTLIFIASPLLFAAAILWPIVGIVFLRIKGRLSLLEPAYWALFGSVGIPFWLIVWAL